MARSQPLTMPAVLAAALLFLLALVAAPRRAGAVSCVVSELSPCLPAMTGPPMPTAECCTKLIEQKPCLCGYMKDPTLRRYWASPNAKKVADACGVPYPPLC